MVRVIGQIMLFLAAAILVPAGASGQDKKKGQKKNDITTATAQDYAKVNQLHDLTGKLVSASEQSVTLRFETQQIEANPNYKPNNKGGGKGGANSNVFQQMQRLQFEQQKLAFIKNPYQRMQRMQQMATQMQKLQMQMAGVTPGGKVNQNNQPYKLVTVSKDFSFDLDAKVSVRRKDPPPNINDQGKQVPYTKAELDKLKGSEKNKPGYEAKVEDLVPGQYVKLSLKASQEKKKLAAEDLDLAGGNANGPKATMVMILMESSEPILPFGEEPKKKKKK